MKTPLKTGKNGMKAIAKSNNPVENKYRLAEKNKMKELKGSSTVRGRVITPMALEAQKVIKNMPRRNKKRGEMT